MAKAKDEKVNPEQEPEDVKTNTEEATPPEDEDTEQADAEDQGEDTTEAEGDIQDTPTEPEKPKKPTAVVLTGQQKQPKAARVLKPSEEEVIPNFTKANVYIGGRWYNFQKGKPIRVTQDAKRVLQERDRLK